MAKFSESLTKEKIAEALLRSGYMLETRIENVLRRRKYFVSANCAYADPSTGKTREFDLFAVKTKPAGPREYDEVSANLICECVNNQQPLALFKKKPHAAFPFLYDNKISGIPLKVFREIENEWMPLRLFINMIEYHHYYSECISTQYCTFVLKKSNELKQWMAYHDDEHFDAFRKLTILTEYFLEKDYKDWNLPANCPILLRLYYPIVVVQGDLLHVEEKDGKLEIVPADHLVYCTSNIVSNQEHMYTIDIVKEGYVDTYLDQLEKELDETSVRLNAVNGNLVESIRKIHELVQQSRVAGGTSIDLRRLLEPERMFR